MIFINITHDLQQNSHITFLELELIMVNSALDFKDLRFGIYLMTILNLSPLHCLNQIYITEGTLSYSNNLCYI